MKQSTNHSEASKFVALVNAAVLFSLLVQPAVAPAQTPDTIGEIVRVSERLGDYLPADARIEVLASGFTWTEGPVWVPDDTRMVGTGYLLFSDIPRNSIFRWSVDSLEQPKGTIELFMRPSGYTGVTYYGLEPGSNGLTLSPEGNLTLCEHGDRRVSMLSTGGGKVTVVDRYQGKRLNSPNDLVFDSKGNLYFTDPPYGLPERAEDPMRELDFCGVYRLDSAGKLELLTDQMTRPNGIGLSPDEKTLYVAQSDPGDPIWMAFPIQPNGSLGEGKQIADAKRFMEQFPGLPDGMTVHSDGTLFASGPGGIYVMLPSGELIGRIVTGGRTSNCTFNQDESTLYITADKQLCRVQIKAD